MGLALELAACALSAIRCLLFANSTHSYKTNDN